MDNLERRYFAGINVDTHPLRIGEGDYFDMLNMRITKMGSYQIAEYVAGNNKIEFAMPGAQNIIIGYHEDKATIR